MAVDAGRLKNLFFALTDIADPAGRQAMLDSECGEDVELRKRIDELLVAHDNPASAVENPLASPGSIATRSVGIESPGQILAGRYKLLEQVGTGGMGSVWVADQIEPVRRRVAIKLIKAGMDTHSVLLRFDAERQALAMMDHPNIARILDGGMTETGRPFFAMEFVKGLPITEYCDQNRLSIEERLNLFVPVCQAVQHAHQKGIIHRDLKPSNILVCLYDGRPVPKVIDFGLAKAMHQSLTSGTVYTSLGLMLGTPLYMSPEQAEVNNLDIDTRSDVYSLGVMLYELLTGTTPLEKHRFMASAWQEIMRLIKEEEPPRPSTRLSDSGSLPSVAAQRHIDPFKLTRQIRGELDWIVMKCLEKDRTRRYPTANSLAEDIQHFLADEIVIARPPSTWYRSRKFFRRYRGRVIAGGLVVLALIAGVVGISLALLDARAERAKADRRLFEVEKANGILASVFADLNPKKATFGSEPLQATLGRRLELASDAIASEAIGDPLTVARVRQHLGRAWQGLGFPDMACKLLEQAYQDLARECGPTNDETLICLSTLASSRQDAGQFDVARELFEELVRLRTVTVGRDHPQTLDSEARLAEHHRRAGRLEFALPLLIESYERRGRLLGPEHPDTVTSLNNLAIGYNDMRQFERATPLFEQVLKLQREVRGPEHPETLFAAGNLASNLISIGRMEEGLPLLESVLQQQVARLGIHHPDTLDTLNNFATACWESGQLDRSIELFEDLYQRTSLVLGASHPGTLVAAANLGVNYSSAGRYEEALPLLQQAFEASRTLPGLVFVEPVYPECLVLSGQPEKALQLLRERVTDARTSLPAGSIERANRLATLGYYLIVCGLGANDEAESVLREALAIQQKLEPGRTSTFNTQVLVGQTLLGQKDFPAAEPFLVEGVEGMLAGAAELPIQHRGKLADGLRLLVNLYTEWDKPEKTAEWKTKLGDSPSRDSAK